eukprot:TRINITY_DN5241_c0_g1_i1.p1 TRINITY_DN5241_c0_g1~~TRINITY_DN5241_c0_g1_i1.p1  ORF type:complete len:311 (+),score=76.30 TRINITY_DN5241_c0_g1_i1:76-1008(+)
MALVQCPADELQAIIGRHDSRRDRWAAQKSRAMERRQRMGGGSAHRSMSEIGAAICGAGYGGDKEMPAPGGYAASRRRSVAPPGGRSNIALDDGHGQKEQESIFGAVRAEANDSAPPARESPKPAPRLSYAEELAAQIAAKKALDSATGNGSMQRRMVRNASRTSVQEDPAAGGSSGSRPPAGARKEAAGAGDSLSRLLAERGESAPSDMVQEVREQQQALAARRAAVPGLEDSPAPAANSQRAPGSAEAASRPPRPSGGSVLTGGGERQNMSSNNYASGGNQNCGNVLTDRRTSRVLKPPGGGSSLSFY